MYLFFTNVSYVPDTAYTERYMGLITEEGGDAVYDVSDTRNYFQSWHIWLYHCTFTAVMCVMSLGRFCQSKNISSSLYAGDLLNVRW